MRSDEEGGWGVGGVGGEVGRLLDVDRGAAQGDLRALAGAIATVAFLHHGGAVVGQAAADVVALARHHRLHALAGTARARLPARAARLVVTADLHALLWRHLAVALQLAVLAGRLGHDVGGARLLAADRLERDPRSGCVAVRSPCPWCTDRGRPTPPTTTASVACAGTRNRRDRTACGTTSRPSTVPPRLAQPCASDQSDKPARLQHTGLSAAGADLALDWLAAVLAALGEEHDADQAVGLPAADVLVLGRRHRQQRDRLLLEIDRLSLDGHPPQHETRRGTDAQARQQDRPTERPSPTPHDPR